MFILTLSVLLSGLSDVWNIIFQFSVIHNQMIHTVLKLKRKCCDDLSYVHIK